MGRLKCFSLKVFELQTIIWHFRRTLNVNLMVSTGKSITGKRFFHCIYSLDILFIYKPLLSFYIYKNFQFLTSWTFYFFLRCSPRRAIYFSFKVFRVISFRMFGLSEFAKRNRMFTVKNVLVEKNKLFNFFEIKSGISDIDTAYPSGEDYLLVK